jgi:hypothetical protein
MQCDLSITGDSLDLFLSFFSEDFVDESPAEYKTKQVIQKWKFQKYEEGAAGFEISILFASESGLVTFLSVEKFTLQTWPAHTVQQRMTDIVDLIQSFSPLNGS